MIHLLIYRPGVISNNSAFEAMALIYKYLQKNHDYCFTIVKSSTDDYYDPSFRIVDVTPRDWKVTFSGLLSLKLNKPQPVLDALLDEADGVLTVDPTAYGQGLVAIEKASLLKKPVWFDTSKTNLQSPQTVGWRLRRRFVLRKALKKCTGIIATVPKSLERFRDLGLLDETIVSKFHIMGHPVDTTQFVPGAKLSKTDGVLRVLVVSRMVPEKGLLYILEAMIPILQANDRIHLQLLGSGMLRPLLEREVAERSLTKQVLFLETIPHKDLPHILSQADVFINHALSIASWEEYFGAVNLEAMACELPCILTTSGGISYAIREKDVAVFVNERSIIQMRESITYLLKHEYKRTEMGGKARSYVKDYYGLPIIAEKYHRMLQRGFA